MADPTPNALRFHLLQQCPSLSQKIFQPPPNRGPPELDLAILPSLIGADANADSLGDLNPGEAQPQPRLSEPFGKVGWGRERIVTEVNKNPGDAPDMGRSAAEFPELERRFADTELQGGLVNALPELASSLANQRPEKNPVAACSRRGYGRRCNDSRFLTFERAVGKVETIRCGRCSAGWAGRRFRVPRRE